MGDYWLSGLNSPREPIRPRKQSPVHRAPSPKPKENGCAMTALAIMAGVATGGVGVIYGVVQGIRAVIG